MLPPQHEWPWEEGFREILHTHTKVTATEATCWHFLGSKLCTSFECHSNPQEVGTVTFTFEWRGN